MKFHLQPPSSSIVTAHGPGWIRVGTTEYRDNIVVTPDTVIEGWAPAGFAALTEDDYAELRKHSPELVLVGTGERHQFPRPALLRALTDARIAVDPMDTRAACRTFNILVAEGRRVVAALIVR